MNPTEGDFHDRFIASIRHINIFLKYFMEADSDNDRRISASDAVEYLDRFGLSRQVLYEILSYVDTDKSGILGIPEFINALKLISLAQSGTTLTPDVVKDSLYGLAAANIPPPQIKSTGTASAENPPSETMSSAGTTSAEMHPSETNSLGPASAENTPPELKPADSTPDSPKNPQSRSNSPRSSESDPTETSGESGMRLVQALSLMLQDGYNLKQMAAEESKRREEVEKKILETCEKVLLSMSEVEAKIYQREKQHKNEVAEIHAREFETADLVKREIEELKFENQLVKKQRDDDTVQLEELKKQKQELEKRVSDLEEYNNRLVQERDDAIKEAVELQNKREQFIESVMSLGSEFSSSELEQATENFSESLNIGEGGFGCVYKGTLRGTTVAIKRLNSEGLQGLSQFQQEVAILTKVRHPNLVNLIGSCSEVAALVYEFLPNGSLEDHLDCANNNTASLTWQARTRIISEICVALLFLHSSKPHLVIHGDLKPDNILLDTNLISKLSDFGISRIIVQSDTDLTAFYQTNHPAGTFAYLDPEFLRTGKMTAKSDVYSFGIIMLRLLTGKPPLNITTVVQEAMQSGTFQKVLDESAGKWPFELAEKLAELGLRCADMLRTNRPDMIQIWAIIEPLVKVASQSTERSSSGSLFNEDDVPSHFICPISKEIMMNPCIAADGFTYEARVIKEWFDTGHNTSPMTNLMLPHLDLIPNHVLRSAIQEWQEHHTCL